jgi:hypothetical protein
MGSTPRGARGAFYGTATTQKNSKKMLGLVFRPFPGEVFELRFGLEKCEI